MKLLICTQKVDAEDSVLGFFHRWIEEFAKQCESVTVICLQEGKHRLPKNAKVLSLGKEKGRSRGKYLARFFSYIWKERRNYDAVLVHMTPVYAVLAGPLWRLWGKRVGLWYTHKSVDGMLRAAEKVVHVIFTASEKSFRLPSSKVHIVGHGIDTEAFAPDASRRRPHSIFGVGRISPTKRQLDMVAVLEKVLRQVPDAKLYLGGVVSGEAGKEYAQCVSEFVRERHLEDYVVLLGAVPHGRMPEVYQQADVLLNLSETGSLDKDVLEAMACDVHPVTTNEAFAEMLPAKNYGRSLDEVAQKIVHFMKTDAPRAYRPLIEKEHSLEHLCWEMLPLLSAEGARPSDVKDLYDSRGKEKNIYEHKRWFVTPRVRAEYEMTKRSIERHALKNLKQANDYIEVGTGPGTWSALFVERFPKANFDFVDISGEMLAQVRERFSRLAHLRTFEADFLAFTPDKQYDLFFSSRAIEYFSDKTRAIEKIRDMLKSGGTGFLITKTPKYGRAKLLGRKVPALHKGQISPSYMKTLLQDASFHSIQIYPVTIHIPIIHSPRLSALVYRWCGGVRLNAASQFISESYCVVFKKQ